MRHFYLLFHNLKVLFPVTRRQCLSPDRCLSKFRSSSLGLLRFRYIQVCFSRFFFLAFDEFLHWKNICKPQRAQRRSHYLEKSSESCVYFLIWEALLKRGKTLKTSEKFRLRPAIGHTIFFTSEKNWKKTGKFRHHFVNVHIIMLKNSGTMTSYAHIYLTG